MTEQLQFNRVLTKPSTYEWIVPTIAKLKRFFIFDEEQAVTSFIARDQSLVDWLLQGREALVKHFAADTKFVLKVVKDSYEGSRPQLVVYVQTQMPVVEAMKKLEAFDNEWLFDQIDFIGNKVIFNLAPV